MHAVAGTLGANAPPWTFPAARVLYQPQFVPVAAARAATPGPSTGLTLLSLFGWTLGGTFIVEWTASPIGPYREVAVLSSLVWNNGRIGAWASHILVTTPDAVDSGRSLFGLPAELGSIAAVTDGGGGADVEFLAADAVRLGCWDGWLEDSGLAPADPAGGGRGWALTLPSFSGCLPPTSGGGGDTATPLLYYPLTLGPARRARLRPALRVQAAAGLPTALAAVLGGPAACPCLQVDGVDVVAGQPSEVAPPPASADDELLLRAWRASKRGLPRWLTGARGSDGDDAPGAALYNMLLIRLPFAAACAALLLNVLLGGGVEVGGVRWPAVEGTVSWVGRL